MLKILDGSGESGKSLSEQDVKDFLTTKVLNVHLGTVDDLGGCGILDSDAWTDVSCRITILSNCQFPTISFNVISILLDHHGVAINTNRTRFF